MTTETTFLNILLKRVSFIQREIEVNQITRNHIVLTMSFMMI